MAYPEDTNGVIVRTVPRGVGIPSAGITGPEKTGIDTRLDALETPHALGSHSDTDFSGISNGQVPLWDSTANGGAGGFVAGTPAGSLSRVGTADGVYSFTDRHWLSFRQGLTVRDAEPANPGAVFIQPEYAGPGDDDTIARGDHYHTTDSVSRTTTAASGYMSSGSRPLGTLNVTLLDEIEYLVEAVLAGQMRGADAGPGYYRLSLTVNGNTRQSPAGSAGFWTVQGVPDKYTWDHAQTILGTGGQIAVSASVAYHSGAGFNVDYSELTVTLRPRS